MVMLSTDETSSSDNIKHIKTIAALPIQGVDLFEETLALRQIISTNCENLDTLLEGGLFTQEVTEVFGPPSVGKTQLALSITFQVINMMSSHVFYFDTSGSFSAERLVEIIQSNLADSFTQQQMRVLLSRVKCHRVFHVLDLLTKLESLKECLSLQHDAFCLNLKLIVIDSLNLLISPILGGESQYGHVVLSKVSLLLKELAYEFGISVLVLNSAVVHYDKNKFSRRKRIQKETSFRPSLGKFWSSVPHIRLFLNNIDRRDGRCCRELRVLKHPRFSTESTSTLLSIGCSGMVSIMRQKNEKLQDV